MAESHEATWDGRRSRRRVHIGRVSMYWRAASWVIYYRENGRAVRVRVGPDRQEAEKRAAEVNAQIAHDIPTTFGFERITIEKLVRHWLEHHELVLRSSVATVCRYRAAADHVIRFSRERHPGLRADSLNVAVAEEFAKFLRTTPVSPNGHPNTARRPLRDKGVLFILGAVRAVMNHAIRQRYVPPYARNPFSEIGIERMRIEDAKPITVLTETEEAMFLRTCDDWQFPVFLTLMFTGMRPGELTHLLVTDVDIANRLLIIRNHPQLGWRTKTRRQRRVHMFNELLNVIEAAVNGRTAGPVFMSRRYAAGAERPPLAGCSARDLETELSRRSTAASRCVEPLKRRLAEARAARTVWHDCGAVTTKRIRLEFMSVTRRIGRPDLTCPKTFRHGMATAMQAAGVDPYARAEMLGHTSLDTTGIYTHSHDLTLAREMERVRAARRSAVQVVEERQGCAGVRPLVSSSHR